MTDHFPHNNVKCTLFTLVQNNEEQIYSLRDVVPAEKEMDRKNWQKITLPLLSCKNG